MSYAKRIEVIASHLASPSAQPETLSSVPTAASSGGLLAGQVAIITGSGQGIGAATAKLFAKEGAKIVVTDLDAAKSNGIAEEIRRDGGQAISVPGDVTDAAVPDKLLKSAVESFGKINILVNNAGYTWDGMLQNITDAQWEAILKVHNTAPFRLIRAATPYMRDQAKKEIQEKGVTQEPRCIINVSSTSGLHGNVGQANYATAKMGIVGLTKTVAKEWGPFNIRCNTVAYGFIDTRLTQAKSKGATIQVEGKQVALGMPDVPGAAEKKAAMIPLGRNATVDEAAGAMLLLASPHASYITGHTLEVTGGAGI